jgi:transglutaminase-like putative cysteine protease
MYERLGGFKVSRGTLPAGDAGTGKTLAIMRGLALEGAKQLEVREAAIGIVREAGAPPHDRWAELRALFEWVRDRVRFTADVAGVETLQGPRYTLHAMAGDCDDRATLLVALARSIGIPADLKFRVIAASKRNPRGFSHVYVVATMGGRSVPMDPTYPSNRLGWQYSNPYRMAEVPA